MSDIACEVVNKEAARERRRQLYLENCSVLSAQCSVLSVRAQCVQCAQQSVKVLLCVKDSVINRRSSTNHIKSVPLVVTL